ncbi:hypothetical protein PT974_11985 [Cladobotryum mycophilum]|uniref:Coenzyme Q-binding protein COQ10 START domain-containing protein n=1 Tax=Cladobotryum mycophilum TaxID=491253 RepID=A0ABR0S6S4_9HYPO
MANATWPPAQGLTTIHVPLQQTVLTLSASIIIDAPAALVWEILLNTGDYGEWNTWCPKITVHSQPDSVNPSDDPQFNKLRKDTSFTLHVVMNSAQSSKVTLTQLRVTDISTPNDPGSYVPTELLGKDGLFTADLTKIYRVAWKGEGKYAMMGLRAERFHEIIILGEKSCEVRTWENQGGVPAYAVRWLYQKALDAKFLDWCNDLKKYSEQKANGQGTD